MSEAFWLLASRVFYDAAHTEGTRGVRQMWQAERDGIPNLEQIAEGCRPLSVLPRETAFAIGTALRCFVSENRPGARMAE
ncbi:hypothetical protein K6V26_09480 [Parabacteroides goldsteinii]|uniref:hypothetical protein n=1 Tax=Parabacteroides goldsteinii TaxID=328812 RepID=UPI001CCD2098|nr:hypothetical protein [Parabacteroides goldsteinii]UBD76522.1 hypothetical protein K6V26_09480 [Parabacteroides goldsteinii]